MDVYVVTYQYEYGADTDVLGVFKDPKDAAACLASAWAERDNLSNGERPGIITGSWPNTQFKDVNPNNLQELTCQDSEGNDADMEFKHNGFFSRFHLSYGCHGEVTKIKVQ